MKSKWVCFAFALLLLGGCVSGHQIRQLKAASQQTRHSVKKNQAELRVLHGQQKQIAALLLNLERSETQIKEQLQQLSRELRQQRVQQGHIRARLTKVESRSGGSNAAIFISPGTNGHGPLRPVMTHAEQTAKNWATGQAKPPAPSAVPGPLEGLTYGAFNRIAFHGTSLEWNGRDDFNLQLYPAGYRYARPIRVWLRKGDKFFRVQPSPTQFSWPSGIAKGLPKSIPLAGFSVARTGQGHSSRYPFLKFLGASYFRGAGEGQPFGAVARAVAINTAVPNQSESFPHFDEFWLAPRLLGNSMHLGIVALLRGSFVAGAYRFLVLPGRSLQMKVQSMLFLEKHVNRVGFAPATSMYLQGPADINRPMPQASAVHDSDGLLVHADHRWVWHPLDNPDRLQVIRIPVHDLKGYGLLQRDRRYEDYALTDGNYRRRPSLWITPESNWGSGNIVLVELPAKHASNDNIVAFFSPAKMPKLKQPIRLNYRMVWARSGPKHPGLAKVTHTRAVSLGNDQILYSIDFEGGDLKALPAWLKLHARVKPPKGIDISGVRLRKAGKQWRLRFQASGKSTHAVRAWIQYQGRDLTEQWMDQVAHP